MRKGLLLAVLLALAAYAPGGHVRAEAAAPAVSLRAVSLESVGVAAVDDGAAVDASAADASSEDTPEGYTLSAAYPNPFQARTRFQLSVDETQRVTVSVYNVLGQRVRSLFSGLVESGQARSFSFEARALPSGLYLYRVEGETFTATRRVTIVR